VANYELGNYLLAQKHFEKALQFSSNDELILEYIYFCYVFSGRFEEARWFSKKFPESLSTKLKTDSLSPFAYVIAEGGAKLADSSRIFETGKYFHAGLSHYVANRFSLFHAVTYFGQGFTDGKALSGQSTQFQYFLRATIPLKKNWQIAPAFHVIHKSVLLHLPIPPPPQPPPGQPPPPKMPTHKDTTTKDNYFVGSFIIKKSIPQFNFGFSSTVSSVFGATQFQHGLSVSFLPVKAKWFIIGSNAFIHSENSYATNYFGATPFLCLKPFKAFSLTTSYLLNTGGKNIVEEDGYIVNNSSDLTTSRLSFTASVTVSKQLDLYALYAYENKQESTNKYVYHYNMFVFGIKIKAK
ncbi:MAG: hypothetical protein IAF38_18545, partial [Bacteroidia bacterium]|nr:hypothetical protein [Bacteroidia bacterium]